MFKKLLIFTPSFILLLLLIPEERLTVFPANGDTAYRLETYIHRQDTTGTSKGFVTSVTDSSVVFEFELGPVNNSGELRPVSGLRFEFDSMKTGVAYDVRTYDFLEIEVTMENAPSLQIYLETPCRGTDSSARIDRRYTGAKVVLEKGVRLYRLPFKSFFSPEWWKVLTGVFIAPPDEPDYSRLLAVDMQSSSDSRLYDPDRMVIRRIEFGKDRRLFAGVVAGSGIAWFFVSLFLTYGTRRQKSILQKIVKRRKPVTLADPEKETLERLTTVIDENYMQMDLSVAVVSRKAGVRLSMISVLLKKYYNFKFNQYLNIVRIAEAKRQLATTNRSVAEIAYAVGYRTVAHFNREFKSHEQVPPTIYRDSMKKSKSDID
jgi:AraC-like DNA-binding protein